MRRGLLVCGALVALSSTAGWAQDAKVPQLTENQALGRLLFSSDCGVCHVPPVIGAVVYGPTVSGDMVKGNEKAIADFIAKGDEKMPGFQYYYTPTQIAAVVDYLGTLPKPPAPKQPSAAPAAAAPAAAPAAPSSGSGVE